MSKITGNTKLSELLNDEEDNIEHKDGDGYNPYRDPKTGKFTTGPETAIAIGKVIEGTAKTTQTVATEASKIPAEKGKIIKGTYPELTNDELQTRINRMKLEQQYSDLKGDSKYVKSGQEKTREALQTIGAVAGIVGAVATPLVALIGILIGKKSKKTGTNIVKK